MSQPLVTVGPAGGIDPVPASKPASPPHPPGRLGSRARIFGPVLAFLAATAAGLTIAAVYLLGVEPVAVPVRSSEAALAIAPDSAADRLARAERSLSALHPRGLFVTVDTYANRLRVHRGDEVLREALCSTGSGLALRDPRNGRLWVFTTPLGERTVQRKAVDPVWVKPDWAFVEEGLVPPPMGSRDRVDTFSLGDFALYLGDGYLIHGTLFQSLLGRRVTHGCIRLGDEDLSYVYRTVPVGARVYLY